MPTLTVTTTTNYQPPNDGPITGQNIALIQFSTAGVATATFVGSQFGGTNISDFVTIQGDANENKIEIIGATSFSAADWSFTNWSVVDDIHVYGTSGANTITGSSQADTLIPGAGADNVSGGDGDDDFYFAAGDVAAGEVINGGLGTDELLLYSTTGAIDFRNATMSGIESLIYTGGTAHQAFLSGSQIGSGKITSVFGANGLLDTLTISGTSINLLSVFFGTWEATDLITLNGTTGDDFITGSSKNDFIQGDSGNDTLDGGAGVDTIRGGDGDDRIVYDALDSYSSGTAGAGIDRLIVYGAAAPTSFDLAGRGFEFAEVSTSDPGGNWWEEITDTYNTSWQRLTSLTVADNGDTVLTSFDVSPGGTAVNWEYISDYRKELDPEEPPVLTNQDGKFDNGGTFAKSYDYAHGTGTDGVADWLSEYTYFFRNVTEQQQGKVLNVEGFADDGRKFTQTNDIDLAYAWTYQTNWYETDGVTLDYLEIRWDNGSTQIIPY